MCTKRQNCFPQINLAHTVAVTTQRLWNFSSQRNILIFLHHRRRYFKDTNPSMSSSLVILFGVVKQFGRLRIWSETECKTPAEYGLQHNSPPPPQTHTVCIVCIYCTFSLGRGEGGGRSERRQRGNSTRVQFLRPWGQQFTSWVENTNMSECISSL